MLMLNLLINTLSKFLAGVIITGLLVFLPAGTLAYYNGWQFMAVLFVPMLILGLILFFKNPELLELRLKSKENSAKQRFLNKRLRWSHLSFQSLFLTSLVTPSYIYIYAALEFLLPLSGQTEGKFPFLTRNRQFLDNKLLIKHNMVSVIP